jgi:GH25 family lysozyme M1 (1,4-beta-N-acetylmuramidase)
VPHRPTRRQRRASRRHSSVNSSLNSSLRRSRLVRSAVATTTGALTLLASAVPAFAAGPSGIDVASFQHPNGAAIDWSAVRQSGTTFAFIKATEGSGYTNPWYAKDYAGAKAAGIYRGGYAFARPSATAGSAAAQARYYVSVNGLASASGDLPPMLDLESNGGLGVAALQSWVTTWLTTVKSLTGRDPVIYVSPYFWRNSMGNSTAFTAYPLFIAEYGVSAPSVPGGWPWWTFWQSSSSGKIGGILSNVDLDQFNGDAAGLARIANVTGAPAPAPAPTPTPTSPSAPTTPSASGFPPPPAGPSHDLNGDVVADVLARDSSGALWTYPGNGRGGWLPRIKTGLYGWNAMNAAFPAGDLSGDGKADVVARDAAGYLYLYPGDGRAGLGPRRLIGRGWNGMTALVAVGDLSGDGKSDLLARDRAGYLYLYPGDGRGALAPRQLIGRGWSGMTALVGIADMSGDGKPDVLARDSSGNLWLYRGTGHSFLGQRSQVGRSWQSMNALVGAGDLNGDGKADLVARDAAGSLWLYPGDGQGRLGARRLVGLGWKGMTLVS